MVALSDTVFAPFLTRAAKRYATQLPLSEDFLALLLLIEDKRFPIHPGVDPFAVVRALASCVSPNRFTEGGSTISQQLYDIQRNERGFPRATTLRRKLAQSAWALTTELRMSKSDILASYLQRAYVGRGYWGFANGSEGYFERPPEQLSPPEQFFLIDRLAAPEIVVPNRIYELLRRPLVRQLSIPSPEHWELMATIYDRYFGKGNELWRILEKLPRQ